MKHNPNIESIEAKLLDFAFSMRDKIDRKASQLEKQFAITEDDVVSEETFDDPDKRVLHYKYLLSVASAAFEEIIEMNL